MPLTLLLRCTDLGRTRAFYESVLAFDVFESAEDTITCEKHGCKLLFTAQDLWKAEPALTGTVYFTHPDLKSFYAQVKDKANIAWPLQVMPYGSTEFALVDCNGYLLAFQQFNVSEDACIIK